MPASPNRDGRGEFTRIVDLGVLRDVAADADVAYLATAVNLHSGTVRGLHFQAFPHDEAKTIWCQSGSVFDVLVDLRESEPTYRTWVSVDLSASEPAALHVPRGVAHGYQTTADNTTLVYLISTPYAPQSARSIHWQDPSLSIDWPLEVTAISERDSNAPTLEQLP